MTTPDHRATPVLTEHRWPWSVQLVDLLTRLLLCTAAAGLAVFLVGVFAMLVLTELYPVVASRIDRVSRMAVGVYAGGGAAALLLGGYAFAAHRWLEVGALRRWGAEAPHRVPVDPQRRTVRADSPSGTLGTAAGWTAGLSGFMVLASVWILFEDPDLEGLTVLAVSLLVCGFGVGGIVLARRIGRGWSDHTRAVASAWATTLPRAVHTDRDRRRAGRWGEQVLDLGPQRARHVASWLGRTAGAATSLSALAGVPGLVLRQPCRDCDPRTLDAAGETTIDWLVTTAFALLVVGLLLGLARGGLVLLLAVVQRTVLQRGARAPRRPRVSREIVAEVLTLTSPERLLGLVLLVAGAAAAPLPLVAALAEEVAGWWTTGGLVGAVLLLAGAGLLLVDHAVGPRWRQRLREAYAPGDVDVEEGVARRRRRGRNRESGGDQQAGVHHDSGGGDSGGGSDGGGDGGGGGGGGGGD
ncbi:hypothetical protein [Desertihabitans aurantiacus]|uniref:hypothetical protein n=1 Tax=Desertihabitans aurantiacus TaxID=2282477 RepID=UPI000DF8545C|nr:hypothetical protein [Desertihabitans aurantiacus]